MHQTRRQFLMQTSAAATAGIVAPAILRAKNAAREQAVKPSENAIIDCHQHLWDLGKFKLPWIKPGSLLARNFVMSDYLAAIEGTGIKHAIYMEVDVDTSQQQAEADHLTTICKSGEAPTIAAVVNGRPAA